MTTEYGVELINPTLKRILKDLYLGITYGDGTEEILEMCRDYPIGRYYDYVFKGKLPKIRASDDEMIKQKFLVDKSGKKVFFEDCVIPLNCVNDTIIYSIRLRLN